ncbi:MAG: 50S ribosomal protein L23 [Myxococcota bacterium]
MSRIYEVLKSPIITEKSSAMKAEANKVAFRVNRDANKVEIKAAVEKLFEVKVEDVSTMINRGKPKRVGRSVGRRQNWKKAIVTLAEGTDLDVFGSYEASEAPVEE